MVSRHAFRGAGTKWIRLDTGDVTDLATLPEATPTKAKAGINDLVLVRIADTIHALHAACAHAGGPLAQGTVVDGCIECPWHGSRFRLTDGHVRRGPGALRPARLRDPRRRGRRLRGPARRLVGDRRDRHRRPEPGRPHRGGGRREVDVRRPPFRARTRSSRPTLPGDRLGRRGGPGRDERRLRASPPRAREPSRGGAADRRRCDERRGVAPAGASRAGGGGRRPVHRDRPRPAAATVLARNAGRATRIVDEAVVRRHLDRLRAGARRPGTRRLSGARGSPRSSSCATRPRSTSSGSGGARPDDAARTGGRGPRPRRRWPCRCRRGRSRARPPRRRPDDQDRRRDVGEGADLDDDDPGVDQLAETGQVAGTERDARLGRIGRVGRLDEPDGLDRDGPVGVGHGRPSQAGRRRRRVDPTAMQAIAVTASTIPTRASASRARGGRSPRGRPSSPGRATRGPRRPPGRRPGRRG